MTRKYSSSIILRSPRPTRLAAAVLLLVALTGGCVTPGPLTSRLHPDVVRPEPGVILLLCDGLQPDLLERGCDEGWLPNIQQRFVAGGLRVENAFTVVPSITYAAINTLLTGTTPATHGIPGNRWFDPEQRLFRNYATIKNYRDVNVDSHVPTIYELLPDVRSTSIQAAHHRGVSDNIANWMRSGILWFFEAYGGVDTLTAATIDLVARRANDNGKWPALITCYFPGADSIGHLTGPDSPRYHRAVRNIDHHVGRMCDWLERNDLLESTYLVLVADHGMVAVNEHIDLLRLIRTGWGRHATDRMLQDGSFEQRRRFFDQFDTVVAHHDGRGASLHFAGPTGWDSTQSPDAVAQILSAPPAAQQLWNHAGIDLVVYSLGPDEAALRSPRGAARIERRRTPTGPEYRYVPVPGDPLMYQQDPELAAFVAAGFQDSRSWLHATRNAYFPDVVPQLVALFENRRFGDVLVFPAAGWSFNRERGGHGGITRTELRIPLLIAGPGIAGGSTIECARLQDVTPQIMTLLGVDPPTDGSLDGQPFFQPNLAAPTDPTMQP